MNAGGGPPRGLWTWLATCFDLGKTAEQVVRAYRTTAWDQPVLYPGAMETLRRLRPLRLGIVTNGSELSQAAKIRNSGLEAVLVMYSGSRDMSCLPLSVAVHDLLASWDHRRLVRSLERRA